VNEPAISVVVISRNEGEYLRNTLTSLHSTLPRESEIVVVDDGSVDGSTDFLAGSDAVRLIAARDLGVAKARNLGARYATGDMIVFADAHVTVPSGWWKVLWDVLAEATARIVSPAISAIGDNSLKGYGLSLTGPDLDADWLPCTGQGPYPVPILPGAFLAMTRKVFDETGGFDDGLLSRGGVDNELCLRLWLLGYELLVVPEIEVAHLFRFDAPFVAPWPSLLHNRLRLTFSHLNRRRVRRVIESFQEHEHFAPALTLTVDSDVFARRAWLRDRRLHDDDWYFDKFDLGW
jgi:GT2 family glycosyltransferase